MASGFGMMTPHQSSSKNFKITTSIANTLLSEQLEQLKSTEKQMKKHVGRKQNPKQITNKLYGDAVKRKESAENRPKRKSPSSTHFQNHRSQVFTIKSLLESFNGATQEIISEKYDFLNIFEVMKKLGFVRQKESISQTEINSDKALFMDFWQYLETHKQGGKISRDLVLALCMAVENMDINDIFKDKALSKLYHCYGSGDECMAGNSEECKGASEGKWVMNKKQINHFHQTFIQFARNRSSHFKMYKKDKYKNRSGYDDHMRQKPNLSKNSLQIARKLRNQYLGNKAVPYCEIRKQSLERKKQLKTEDQIGGLAVPVLSRRSPPKLTNPKKEKNRELLRKWHQKEVEKKSKVTEEPKFIVFDSSAVLEDIPEEINTVITPSTPLSQNNMSNKTAQGGAEPSSTDNTPVPLLSIDVNFGPEMHDKITVFANDDLNELAKTFAKKHNLPPNLEDKLQRMLNEQVNSIS